MGLSGRQEILLEDSKGKRYNLYLNEAQELYCITSNGQNQWVDKQQIFTSICKGFDALIDARDVVHAFSCHKDGSLYYHTYQHQKWSSLLILSGTPAERALNCRILSLHGKIHLFYHLRGRNLSLLYHCRYDEASQKWIHLPIAPVVIRDYINPFYPLVYDQQLLIAYISITQGYEQLKIKYYNEKIQNWEGEKRLTDTPVTKLYLDALVDEQGVLHATWSNHHQDTLQVQYLQYSLEGTGEGMPKVIAISDRLNCSFPHLILYPTAIQVIWVQYNHLVTSHRQLPEGPWSQPKEVPGSKQNHFKRYRYLSNIVDQTPFLQANYLFGTLYPKIQFLGLGGEPYDEVSNDES